MEEVSRGLRAPPTPEKKTVAEALDYWLTNRAPQKWPCTTPLDVTFRGPSIGLRGNVKKNVRDEVRARRLALSPSAAAEHVCLRDGVLAILRCRGAKASVGQVLGVEVTAVGEVIGDQHEGDVLWARGNRPAGRVCHVSILAEGRPLGP